MERDFIPQAKLTEKVFRKIFQTGDVRLVIDIEEPLRFLDVSPEMNVEFTDGGGQVFGIPLYAIKMMRREDAQNIPQGKLTVGIIRDAFGMGRVRFVVDIQAPKLMFKDVTERRNLVFCDHDGRVFLIPLSAVKLARPKKVYPREHHTRPVEKHRGFTDIKTPVCGIKPAGGNNVVRQLLAKMGIF